MKPIYYEEVTATTSTAIGLTAATVNWLVASYPNVRVLIQCQTYPAAFTWFGTPTASTVQQIAVGDYLQFVGEDMMLGFLAIGIGGSAKLAVNYFSGE